VVQPKGTSWDKLEYVGQVGQGEGGLQILVGQVGQGEGGLQIFVRQVGQVQGVCPLEPFHLSQMGLQGRGIFHGLVDPLCGTSWDKWNWDKLHRGYRACPGTRKGLQRGYMTCPMGQGEVSFDLS